MKIAIIGAGNVGKALASGWSKRGHDVTFGVRDPREPKYADLGKLATIADAARGADVVVLATPPKGTLDAVRTCGDVAGKVLVDCTNAFDATLSIVEASVAPAIAAAAPSAHVVKAFNTTGAANMSKATGFAAPLAMFLCGDDAAAKRTVATLAAELDFDPVDVGPLSLADSLEHLALIWVTLAFKQKRGVDFGYAIVSRPS